MVLRSRTVSDIIGSMLFRGAAARTGTVITLGIFDDMVFSDIVSFIGTIERMMASYSTPELQQDISHQHYTRLIKSLLSKQSVKVEIRFTKHLHQAQFQTTISLIAGFLDETHSDKLKARMPSSAESRGVST